MVVLLDPPLRGRSGTVHNHLCTHVANDPVEIANNVVSALQARHKHVPPEQPHPQWTLFEVSSLIYEMEGACNRPQYYTLPGFDHWTPSNKHGKGGKRKAMLSMPKATKDV